MSLKFCLDAGHGGKDPGAINEELSLKEAHAALNIVKKLKSIMESKGWDTKLTRESDTYPGLTERCIISNNYKPTAFISIHLNSSDNKTARGVETLIYTGAGPKTRELAENVQKNLITATGFKDRGVKERNDLTVLKKTYASAILVEVGFISNNDEAKLLHKDVMQNNIVEALVRGIELTYC